MSTLEHLAGQWREWRYAHVADMFRPYGWTSLVAQYWLHDGDVDREFELLPGSWSVREGKVIFTPPASGPSLSVDGAYPEGPVEIVPGRNMTYGHGDSRPVYYGDCEVETLVRSTDDGEAIYAVRVRDPKQASDLTAAGITEYPYDPAWRIPARFTPTERVDVEAVTVESGVREVTPHIGTLEFTHGGREYSVVVLGKDTDAGTVQPVAHVRDRTSGPITYGAGRTVELQFADDSGERIDFIDFNYAAALPCAFTNFVTCPLPPQQNNLDFEVTAGEKKPVIEVARSLTYQGAGAGF